MEDLRPILVRKLLELQNNHIRLEWRCPLGTISLPVIIHQNWLIPAVPMPWCLPYLFPVQVQREKGSSLVPEMNSRMSIDKRSKDGKAAQIYPE